jgi:sugar lactone lactonase YvrE
MKFWNHIWTAALALMIPVSAFALRTGSLTDEGYASFYRGELKNLSLSNTGELEAAPLLQEVVRLDEPVVWAAVPDGAGNLILGTGNDGVVLRLAPDGTVEKLFDPDLVLSRALAVAPDGSIFVGASPNGAIYRLPPDGGKPEVFLDLPDVYIWSLTLEGQNLWVTTGFEARLLRVPLADDFRSAGEVEVWLKTRDDHLTTLARDDKRDRWIVGAAHKGIVYAVKDPTESYALVEVNDDEVRALEIGSDGAIYFTTFAEEEGSSSSESESDPNDLPPLVVTASGGSGSDKEKKSGSGYFYRIEEGGFTVPLWRSTKSGIFSLAAFGSDYWLAGTNAEGKLFYFHDRDDWGLQHQLPRGGEVSIITPVPDGSGAYYVISSNPGVVYRLGGMAEAPSVFESRVLDARQPVNWGAFELTLAANGANTVFTRAGNTSEPDGTWSSWQSLEEGRIASPVGRYLQYKVELPGDSSARVLRARVFYQMLNVPPQIAELKLLNFGAELQTTGGTPSALDFQAAFRDDEVNKFESGTDDRLKLTRLPEQSFRTVIWRAGDPNGDSLLFDLFLRKADAEAWTTLGRELEDPAYVLNAAGLEAGLYQVKLVASDAPTNTPEETRTTTKISALFLLDATPPEIARVGEVQNGTLTLQVSSDAANLVAAQIAIDGGEPRALRPVDGLFDTAEELFEVALPEDLPAGATVLFEVLDEAGNQAMWAENLP